MIQEYLERLWATWEKFWGPTIGLIVAYLCGMFLLLWLFFFMLGLLFHEIFGVWL